MAYIDSLGLLSNAQAVTADAVSTNVVDLGNVTPKRQIGAGKTLWVSFAIGVAADFTTTDETYTFRVDTSAAANMSSPVTLASRTIAASVLVAGYQFHMAIPQDQMLRYLSAYYDVGGTTPTITVTAWVTDEEPPEHSVYASGTTQAV